MAIDWAQLQDWSQLIRAEYEELPDLQLTQSQVEELWGLDNSVADALLSALVSAGVLKKTQQGAYVRADERCWASETSDDGKDHGDKQDTFNDAAQDLGADSLRARRRTASPSGDDAEEERGSSQEARDDDANGTYPRARVLLIPRAKRMCC